MMSNKICIPSGPRSILDVRMRCQKCGAVRRAGDCLPDVDGEGSLGCPRQSCGGIAIESEMETSRTSEYAASIFHLDRNQIISQVVADITALLDGSTTGTFRITIERDDPSGLTK